MLTLLMLGCLLANTLVREITWILFVIVTYVKVSLSGGKYVSKGRRLLYKLTSLLSKLPSITTDPPIPYKIKVNN